MNKIIFDGDKTRLVETDGNISFELVKRDNALDVYDIKIVIEDDTDILVECHSDFKASVEIDVLKEVKANLYEFKTDGDYKFQYKYNLEKKADLRVEKVYDVKTANEMTIIDLNGDEAKLNYFFKTVSTDKEKYSFLVHHNGKKSISNIINNGVNILNGSLEFNVSGFVNRGVIGCDVNQNNRIINLTRNKCVIEPNLFIDEYDVVANHAAHIGTFSFDEIFYLMSRGIPEEEAENLLTKGFLLKDITKYKEELSEVINKYWR